MGILTLPLITSLIKPHKLQFSLLFTTTIHHHHHHRRTLTPFSTKIIPLRSFTNSATAQHDQSQLTTDVANSNADERTIKVSIPTFQQAIQRLQVIFTILTDFHLYFVASMFFLNVSSYHILDFNG